MFATERLTVAPIEEEHLDDLFAVYVSNPDYLRLTEGTADGVGVYSKEQMLRDLQVAEWTGRTPLGVFLREGRQLIGDRKSTRLNSSHVKISYAVFCLKKKKKR